MARQDFWYNPEAKKAGLPPTGCKGAGFIWLSTQIGVDLETGAITRNLEDLPKEGYDQVHIGPLTQDTEGGPVRAQTWKIYDNLRKILSQQGASLEDIVCQRVYLRNIEATQAVESAMLAFFPDYKPATYLWRMNDRGLNDDIHIQVEAIAVDPKSKLQKESVYVPELAKVTAPYPQAVKVGQFLFSSALYGIDPATGRLPICRADLTEDFPQVWTDRYYSDACTEAAKAQLVQLIKNLERLMASQGATMKDVRHIHQWMCRERLGIAGIYIPRNVLWTNPMDSPTPTGFMIRRIASDPRVEFSMGILGLLPGPIRKEVGIVAGRSLGYNFPSYCKMGPLWVMAGEIPGDMVAGKGHFEFSELPDAGRFLAQGRNHPHRTMVQSWFLYQIAIKHVLREAGLDFSNVVLQRIFMRDVSQYPAVERIAQLAFNGNIPATSVVGVDELTAFADESSMLEIEFTCDTT